MFSNLVSAFESTSGFSIKVKRKSLYMRPLVTHHVDISRPPLCPVRKYEYNETVNSNIFVLLLDLGSCQ